MHKILGVLVLGFAVIGAIIGTTSRTQAIEPVVQEVVITASVEHARYIIVNETGAIIKIYSNTNQSVTPQVRLDAVTGATRPLTPALQASYEQLIANRSDMVGAEIIVPDIELAKATTPSIKAEPSFMQPDIQQFFNKLSSQLLKFE